MLCIQMEAFILPLLGLHPSNGHLTGIPMFPANPISDSVFSSLIWKVLKVSVFLQTDGCKAPSGRLNWGGNGLTRMWSVSYKIRGWQTSIFTLVLSEETSISVLVGCAAQWRSWGSYHRLVEKHVLTNSRYREIIVRLNPTGEILWEERFPVRWSSCTHSFAVMLLSCTYTQRW